MAKEVTLLLVLKEDQVGIAVLKKVARALLEAKVITTEDEVHLLGPTYSFIPRVRKLGP